MNNITFRCQVCDYEAKPKIAKHAEDEYEEWTIQTVDLKNGKIDIITCAKCSALRIDEIFEGYKTRIRAGKDTNFH